MGITYPPEMLPTGSGDDDAVVVVVGAWQPIATAPKDGTWFMICREDEHHNARARKVRVHAAP